MRPWVAAAFLALLAGPALAQTPSLAVVPEPTYSVGDFWTYKVVFLAGNDTTFPQDQTVRVVALEDFQGVAAVRLFTESVQDIPGDAQSGDIHATSNKTTWVTQQGQRILRIEEEVDRTQATAQFRIWTHREVNWTFHQPMDLWQFPILEDDAWVVVTNATIESNTTLRTHVVGNEPREVPARYENGTIFQTSATSWVRQDTCGRGNNCTPAGDFQGIVLVSRSGNATIRDFYSPQVGNLVRREILNESGALAETSTLVAYRFAKAPDAGARPPGGDLGGAAGSLLPVAGAAVLGIGVALGALALAARMRKGKGEAPPAEPAPPSGGPPQEPAPPAPPPPTEGEPPPPTQP